ncbi:MAG: MotA/TolQ/ExbB proton channel family protein [Fibrobacteres bacterium]|nr:MotA/TolQ/ExbB proton channel family protein [Fibrobacterota bacterium]
MSFIQKFLLSFSANEPGYGFMWVLLVFFIFAIALIIERGIFLMRKTSGKTNVFMASVFDLLKKDNIPEALKLCDRNDNMALSRVVKAGLENAANGVDKITAALEEKTLSTVPMLEQRTNYLAMTANVATLIGLMGTIYGLIVSFAAVGAPGIDPAQKSTLLAQGIAAAMNTTLAGLAIAIPAIVVFTFYQNVTQRIIDDIDEFGLKLSNVLTERSRKTYKYHISTAQIKEGIGIHVTHGNIKIFTDNTLIKEINL